jgi:hypothetical protein
MNFELKQKSNKIFMNIIFDTLCKNMIFQLDAHVQKHLLHFVEGSTK